MKRQKSYKLKNLLNGLPHGYLIDTKGLAYYGIDHRLVHKHLRAGWLERVTRGVYRRPFISHLGNQDQKTGWRTTVLSMMLMGYQVHVGAATALYMQGFRHYLPFGEGERIFLYGDAPSWLSRLPSNDTYVVRNLNLFGGLEMGIGDKNSSFANDQEKSNAVLNPLHPIVRISQPERAILEMLNELPKQESFHMVDVVFEGLYSLRPAHLQSLLSACKSIKTKRLFLVFAERHNHAWRRHLTLDQLYLGRGPRALVKDGQFHPRYQISVPEEYICSPDAEYGYAERTIY